MAGSCRRYQKVTMMETKKYYTGIGSRKSPESYLRLMESLGEYLGTRGWVLRSGGAEGADAAFEKGCDKVRGLKEIFLPWKKFNNSTSPLSIDKCPTEIKRKAFEIAEKFHPAWDLLGYGARCLMARNTMQVLGWDLETPTSFVVCYNLGALTHGGTSQALRIALDKKIPIFRLSEEKEFYHITKCMDQGLNFL